MRLLASSIRLIRRHLQAASQISGMTPAALDILQIYIKMAGKK